ncbi:thiol peroxidase [Mariniflexile soesokkakense]|uniref:Thiol peroxidase n=1 Tax=Mariniflexile soesokkakense TaxID=1343160 RepID=A0ABV0A7E5_9FLAO
MATLTLKGNKINTIGELPKVGTTAPDFELVKTDLSTVSLKDYKGSRVILNIFHSIDTSTCIASARQFNIEASELENTKILCISKDLPFAMTRFCDAEGIKNLEMLSDYVDGQFGKDYNLLYVDGVIKGLLSRCIIILDENSKIIYTEQVEETSKEPNYKAALEALYN